MKTLLLGNSIINQFMQVIPITLLIGIVYIIFRSIYVKRKKIYFHYKQEFVYFIFLCYIVLLSNLLLVPSNFWSRIWHFIFYGFGDNPFAGMFDFEYNFIPTLYKIIKGEYILGNWVKTMMIGNVVMFIPMGVLIKLCFKKIKYKNIFWYALWIPFGIELLQPIIGRSFDIDDILCNFLGILLGHFIIALGQELIKKIKN